MATTHYTDSVNKPILDQPPFQHGDSGSGPAGAKSQAQEQSQPELGRNPLPIFWRGDVDYERARVDRVFNLRRPSRYPVAVLEARNASDVIRGVKLARERGVQVSLRSGGHSWAAWSVRKETLLIDLGNLKELSYDVDTKIVTCSPSITGGDLNPFLAKYGQFFAGGHCPTVGIGGFLLQGGQGWWARAWGWSCEQIDSIDVVLPSGELVTASETQNADLLWAARGAGPGFFGVVVRFRLRTRPRPMAMQHVTYILPAKAAYHDVFCWIQELCQNKLDPHVETVFLAFTRSRLFGADKLKPGQDPMESMLVVRGVSMSDSEEVGRAMLEPMLSIPHKDIAEVAVEIVPTSMAEEYAQQLADNPPGKFWSQNSWLVGEPKDVADSMELAFTTLPSEKSFFLWYSMGPLRPLPDMAFSLQSEHYLAGYIISQGDNDAEEHHCAKWLKDRFDYVDSKKDGPGGTIGQYLGDSDLAVRSAKIMTDENWDKFCAIRQKYDPNNLFVGYLHGDHVLNKASWQQ